MVSNSFSWFQVILDGFKWFQFVPRFSKYETWNHKTQYYFIGRNVKWYCANTEALLYPGTSFILGWDFISVTCKRTPTSHRILNCQKHLSQMFFKIVVLKNFAVFLGKQLCWSLFLIKLLASWLSTSSKRDSGTGVFL